MADLAALAEELMRREMATNPEQFKRPALARMVTPEQPISPEMLHTLGGLADAAGTYLGMRFRAGREGNPLVAAIGRQQPELTGATAVGGLLAAKGIAKLLRKVSPKVADVFSANLGAEQVTLGSNWVRRLIGDGTGGGAMGQHVDMLNRWNLERDRRQGGR